MAKYVKSENSIPNTVMEVVKSDINLFGTILEIDRLVAGGKRWINFLNTNVAPVV